MNLTESICKFIERNKDKFLRQQDHNRQMQPEETEAGKYACEQNPREGMSLESAKLAIGRCANNSEYQIQSLKNEGRYFSAKLCHVRHDIFR